MKQSEIDNLQDKLNEHLQNLVKDIPFYIIKIGVFIDSDKDIRTKERYINDKGEPKIRKKKDPKKGLTNAEIMFIMENGSPMNNIPHRPVLKKTVKYAQDNLRDKFLIRALKEYFSHYMDLRYFENELLIMCMDMEKYAKKGIRRRELGLIPNKLSTIEKKHSDIPLLDTGQLANSIQARLYRYGTEEVKTNKEDTGV